MVKECKTENLRRPNRKLLSLLVQKRGSTTLRSGVIEKTAIQEAQRCLSLRTCESCEICSLFCPDLCITRDEKTGEVRIDLDYCKGCGICAAVCPRGAIEMVLEEGM